MCKYCDNIPEYPKLNILNEDLGISKMEDKIQLCSETYNLLVHTTNHIPINYCPICGKKLIQESVKTKEPEGIYIYTDGAFRPSVNQGGWAYVVVKDGSIIFTDYGGHLKVTNNIMELYALIKAMLYINKNQLKNVIIYTDSQYVWGCATQGWKRTKNIKLWDKFNTVANSIKQYNYSIEWVKGHADNTYNNKADELAVRGSKLVL